MPEKSFLMVAWSATVLVAVPYLGNAGNLQRRALTLGWFVFANTWGSNLQKNVLIGIIYHLSTTDRPSDA